MSDYFCILENLLEGERSGKLQFIDEKMWKSKFLDSKTRSTSIDWLRNIHNSLNFVTDTFFFSVIFFDCCLENINISNNECQLYVCASLLLASKYTEIRPLEIKDLINVLNDKYSNSSNMIKLCSPNEFRELEKEVFEVCDYNLNFPNIMEIIRYVSNFCDATIKQHTIAKELSILFYLKKEDILPSVVITSIYKIIFYITDIHELSPNPFDVPFDIIDSVSRIITKKFFEILNSPLKTTINIMKYNFKKININWDDFESKMRDYCVKNIISKSYKSNHKDIPLEYAISYYTLNKKLIPMIENNQLKTISILGEGAYGIVYKVKDIHDNIYALKKVNNFYSNDDDGVSISFIKEVAFLSDMQHENVVNMKYVVAKCQKILLNIAFCDLQEFYQKEHEIIKTPEFQNLILMQLVNGLNYMHNKGIMHRDIKPQNILVYDVWPNITLKYCDFGTARKGILFNYVRDENFDNFYFSRKTKKCIGYKINKQNFFFTTKISTLWYRAPEILLGDTYYNASVDIWSLMCTMYEVVDNNILFKGYSKKSQIHEIFEIMGTPTDENWKNVTNLPKYRPYPKFTAKSLPFKDHFTKEIITVIKKGLITNPIKRATCAQILLYIEELTPMMPL